MASWRKAILEQVRVWRPGFILDVGCNVGAALADISTVAVSGDHYLGFDANPLCVRITRLRAHLYPHLPVQVIEAAAWNCSSTGLLLRRGWNPLDPSATLRPDLRPGRLFLSKRRVALLPIDSVEQISEARVSAAKIDVEGTELEVLDGMRNLIARDRFPIIVEILARDYQANSAGHFQRWKHMLDFFSNLNYRLHPILKLGIHSRVSAETVFAPRQEVWTWRNRDSQDYVALPAEVSQTTAGS